MRITAKRHDCTALLPTRGCPAYCSPLRQATARSALLLLGLAAALPPAAFAQSTYNWNGGNGTWAVGNAGAWDAGNWAAGNDAVFAGTPGTVTVSAGIAPASTTINAAGYTFTPGVGLVDWGTGPVAINADVTFVGGTDRNWPEGPWTGTGNVTVSGGSNRRVILSNTGTTWTGDLTIAASTRLQTGYNVSIPSTTITNSGNLVVLSGSLTLGGLTGSGVVTSSGGLTVGALNTDTTFSGAIQNSVALTKTGTGTLTLSGTNTSSGSTTISGGTLQIGDGGATGTLGSGAVSIATGATLAFDRSGGFSVANAISGNGSLVQSGPGAISLTGTNTYAGGTTVTAGILGFSGQGSIPDWGTAGAVTVGAGGALAVGNDTSPDDAVTAGYLNPASGLGFDTSAGDRIWPTAITSTRPFVKTGANTLTLTAVNTHSGLTTIDAGTLELQSNADQTLSGGLSGGGTLRKSGTGTLTLSGTNSFTGGMAIDAGTLVTGGNSSSTGTLSGSGDIVKTGSDTLAFSSASGYSGAATVVAGTLQLAGAATPTSITLGTADTGSDNVQITLGANTDRTGFTAPITVSNQGTGTATIKWIETASNFGTGNGLITIGRATTFDASQFAGGFVSVNHALTGSGDLTLTTTNGTRFIMEAASAGYTGDITVQNGGIFEPRNRLTATSGNNLTLDSGARVNVNSGLSIGGLNGAGLVTVASGSGTLTLGKGNASGSFSGAINPGVSLVKTGTGTQVLSGASTTSSAITINAGTLEAANNAALGTGNVTIANGATLRVAAGTSIANTLSLAGSTLELESPEALGTVAGLIAGTSTTPASLTPTVAWSPQVAGTTYSDVLGLTNTAGTVQILEIAYDPATLGSIAPADLFLGWDANGAWVNAIDGNSGSAGGSAVFDQTGSLTSLGILATSDYLGSWGRDTTANTVWAVIDHNSDFAAIGVPEPATLALAGVAAATLGLGFVRRRLRRSEVR